MVLNLPKLKTGHGCSKSEVQRVGRKSGNQEEMESVTEKQQINPLTGTKGRHGMLTQFSWLTRYQEGPVLLAMMGL